MVASPSGGQTGATPGWRSRDPVALGVNPCVFLHAEHVLYSGQGWKTIWGAGDRTWVGGVQGKCPPLCPVCHSAKHVLQPTELSVLYLLLLFSFILGRGSFSSVEGGGWCVMSVIEPRVLHIIVCVIQILLIFVYIKSASFY